MKPILRLILVALLTVAAGTVVAWGARPLPEPDEKPTAEKPVRTDLYGDPLPEGAIARLGSMFGRHERNITAVAFAKDGKTFASGDQGGMVCVWGVSTGKKLREFRAYNWGVHALAFSPLNNDLLVVAGTSKSFYGWNIATGRIVRGFHGHQLENVLCLTFSADGKRLASGGDDAMIRIWNLEPDQETVEEVAKLEGHRNRVGAVAFSPDGRFLASGGSADALSTADRSIRIWDLANGRQLHRLEGHVRLGVHWLSFSPAGRHLASAGDRIFLWDVQAEKGIATLEQPSRSVIFLLDGKRLVCPGHRSGFIEVRDAALEKVLHQFQVHNSSIRVLSLSPDGRTIASSAGSSSRLWDVDTGRELSHAWSGHTAPIGGLAFSPDGKKAATYGYDWTVRVWESATGKELLQLNLVTNKGEGPAPGRHSSMDLVAFSADGKWLAAIGANAADGIKVWDAVTGVLKHTLIVPQTVTTCVRFSPDSSKLASGDNAGSLQLWDLASGQGVVGTRLPPVNGNTNTIYSLAWSRDGKIIALGCEDGGIVFYETQKREIRGTLVGHRARVVQATFSNDGKSLVSLGQDQTIRVWDGEPWGERQVLTVPPGTVRPVSIEAMALHPDGQTLVVHVGQLNTLVVCRLPKGDITQRVPLPEPLRVSVICFSPDGQTLATVTESDTVLIWKFPLAFAK